MAISLLTDTSDVALAIVNYVLDVYRFVTGETHIETVWSPVITQVFFSDHNLVFEGVTVPHGLRSAIANRSKEEIDRVANMLSRGDRPSREVLLLHSSRAALDRRETLVAVLVAFQALEIYLETRLRAGFQLRVRSRDHSKTEGCLQDKGPADETLQGTDGKFSGRRHPVLERLADAMQPAEE